MLLPVRASRPAPVRALWDQGDGATPPAPTRRAFLLATTTALTLPPSARASKLGAGVDAVWQGVTGAPPDLYFPASFAGLFDAESTLTAADAPRGDDALPAATAAALARARANDLGMTLRYRARFLPAPGPAGAKGAVILDRAFNTANLLAATPGGSPPDTIDWDPTDPNELAMRFSGGLTARVRVTRRSQSDGATPASTETSEFS